MALRMLALLGVASATGIIDGFVSGVVGAVWGDWWGNCLDHVALGTVAFCAASRWIGQVLNRETGGCCG